MYAFRGGRVRIVDPPIGMHRRDTAGTRRRRKHGGEFARLSVESGKIALNPVRPDLGVARRKTESQDTAVVGSFGGNAAVEEHFRGIACGHPGRER